MQALRELIEVDKQLREAEDKVDQLKKQRSTLDKAAQRDLLAEGVDSITLDGVKVTVKRTIWSKALVDDKALIADRLKELPEFEALVENTYNSNKLSALVRGFERDEDDMPIIPDELKDFVGASETRKLVCKH